MGARASALPAKVSALASDPLLLQQYQFSTLFGEKQVLFGINFKTFTLCAIILGFLGDSPITDYHAALGQFLNYRLALELNESDRKLYLQFLLLCMKHYFSENFYKFRWNAIKLTEPANERYGVKTKG